MQSSNLNKSWLSQMFGTPWLVTTYARSFRSVGEAAMLAKVITGVTVGTRRNNEKYNLLGDPAFDVRFGRRAIRFERSTVVSQSVEGLLRVIRGEVVDEDGNVLDGTGGTVAFNGTAFAHVTENADTSGYEYDQGKIEYDLDGPTTYRGELPVTNGRFEAKFYLSEATLRGRSLPWHSSQIGEPSLAASQA